MTKVDNGPNEALADLLSNTAEHGLTIEVIRNTEGFDRIQNEWEGLIEKTHAHIFQTYEWQRLWWKYFGGDRALCVMLFRYEETLVGVAPLFLESLRLFSVSVSRTLRLIGCDTVHPGASRSINGYSPTDYLDLIVLPGFEEDVARSLLEYLSAHSDFYDKVEFKEIPQDSFIKKVLVPRLCSLTWEFEDSRIEVCPRLRVPASAEEFKRGLHSKVRYQLSQTKRAVTEQKLFFIEAIESEEDLDRAFLEFVRLHQRRWIRIGYPGVFADDYYKEFLKEVTRAFLKRGWLWFRTARSDGECIAAQCAFKFKDSMYDYLKAFDDESPLAKRRPGRALLLFLIEEAIRDKMSTVDLLRGGEKYKFELTSDAQYNHRIVISNSTNGSKLRSRFSRALAPVFDLGQRAAKESFLVRLHLREWRFQGFLFHYIPFLWKRLLNSIRPSYKADLSLSNRQTAESGMTGKLEVEVITEPSKFLTLRDEWNRLVAASNVTIFQTFDWQWLWWKYFGDTLQLHLVLFRKHGELVAIAPMYLEPYTLLGLKLHRRLRFIGGAVEDWRSQWDLAQFGPSDYLDIIVLPGSETDVTTNFLAYLREAAAIDEAEFENVPQESTLLSHLVPELKRHSYPYRAINDHICPRITVPSSVDEYLRGRSSKFRYQLSQTRKAAGSQGLFSIEAVQSGAELQEALRELIRLHQLRWNRIGYPGLFADSRFKRFQEEVTQRFLEHGWLWFRTVRMDGQCIAARLGFKFKDSLCDYIAGFDDRSPGAKRRPGFALIISMLEDAINAGLRTLDFLRGYETYKFDLTSELPYNWKLVVVNPNSQPALRIRLYRAVHYVELLLRKLFFELTIFKVHYRKHRFHMIFFSYVAFRWKKLSDRIASKLKVSQ